MLVNYQGAPLNKILHLLLSRDGHTSSCAKKCLLSDRQESNKRKGGSSPVCIHGLACGIVFHYCQDSAGMREIKLFVSDFGMTLPLSWMLVKEMSKMISWFVILLFVLELFFISSSESIVFFSLVFSACLFLV